MSDLLILAAKYWLWSGVGKVEAANPMPANVRLKQDLNIFLARHSFQRRAVPQRGV